MATEKLNEKQALALADLRQANLLRLSARSPAGKLAAKDAYTKARLALAAALKED